MRTTLPLLVVLPLVLGGCYAIRNPAPDPGAGTALAGEAARPVRDPADDFDTVSRVEPGDAPGDAGALSPGAR